MRKPNACFMACEAEYNQAQVVLFGAPFDGTVSYRPGARFGPSAMRAESFGIETYSPYLQKDLADCAVFDAGDLELPFGNPKRAVQLIAEMTNRIVQDGKLPVMLGGEHLVTLGCVQELAKLHPNLCIVHFDAHADLREEYLGEQLSHACVLRRCHELVGDGNIFQFGIRSMTREEDAFACLHTIQTKYTLEGIEEALRIIGERPVYLTVDLDVLDPSVLCGTGTPEPGGVSFVELMEAVHCMRSAQIVGADINELAPQYDASGASAVAACKLLRELLLTLNK